MLTIKRIDNLTETELADLKDLISEYGRFLYGDICLVAGRDSFYSELEVFPGDKYAAPHGTFFLALFNNEPAGCIGLRRYDSTACEMKRMYVRPSHRGRGIAIGLCNEFLHAAKQMGYEKVLLDTNKEMPEAVGVYNKLGFVPIPAYCANENANPLYFMKML